MRDSAAFAPKLRVPAREDCRRCSSRFARARPGPPCPIAMAQCLLLSSQRPENAMTGDDILLVQESWLSITPVKQITAELFYDKLFELDPGLRALLQGDA